MARYAQTHNTLDRATGTTGPVGSLFTLGTMALREASLLSVYARVAEGYEARLAQLFAWLAETGFGADVSTGKGEFALASALEEFPQLDAAATQANGVVVLSTFQPGATDSTEGVCTKFGKLGPDFGLENVFKRPAIMLRPGACFVTTTQPGFVGRAIPMAQLLAAADCQQLQGLGAEVFQLAFGLAVPARLKLD